MKIKAVIDRFEGEFAVLLLGNEEFKIDWPHVKLPSGAKEGDILDFELNIDTKGTEKQKEKIKDKLQQLKARNKNLPQN